MSSVLAMSRAIGSYLKGDISKISNAANLVFNETIKTRIAEGHRIAHLAFGQSPFPLPPGAAELLGKYANETSYLSVQGHPTLREAVARFHHHFDQVHSSASQVVVGPGSKELLFLLLRMFNGVVLLPSPTWVTYQPQCNFAATEVVVIPSSFGTDRLKLTTANVEQALQENRSLIGDRPLLLVLCHPNNPTGLAYTEDELISLTELFRKYGILVISDEIYSRLDFEGSHKHCSLATVYPEGTILSSGMSKAFSAGGWRIGYQIYPERLHELQSAVVAAGGNTFSCGPAPQQLACARLMNDLDACQRYFEAESSILRVAATHCRDQLLAAGARCHMADSTYYLMPEFGVCQSALARRKGVVDAQLM